MKTIIKRVVACIVFSTILLLLIGKCNDVLISKTYNRYYVMDKAIEEDNRNYEVQVFGACHSYTSFNAKSFEETQGLSSYVLGNPGEIIPVTYLRMYERFKKDVPKVALVEIWGINAYETYSSTERVFGYYMPPNIETIPLSFEKLKVIRDFYSLDMVLENFAVAKYKDRVANKELSSFDFNYSFEEFTKVTSDYDRVEMTMRIDNNGFCEMPYWEENPKDYTPYKDVSDYNERQAKVEENETLELESDMLKYVDKIIELCEENDVELIFYRAPYVSTENELKKANWFAEYCKEKDVAYFDLEKEIDFDLTTDFLDHEHLNKYGAEKATNYLTKQILKAIN